MSDGLAKHRTRKGVTHTLPITRLEQLRAEAALEPKKAKVRGVVSTAVVASHFLIIQIFLAQSGMEISPEAVSKYALSAAGLELGLWRLLSHPFLHPDVHSLVLNLAGLLFFGATLGWRHGRWMVLCTFFFGAAVGGSFFLLAGIPSGETIFYGADAAAFSVLAASVLTNPRLSDKVHWVPWNVIAGLVFFVAYVLLETPLFSTGEVAFLGLFAAVLTGLVTVAWIVEPRHRNDYRLAAVFFAIGAFFLGRLLTHVALLVLGVLSLASVAVWAHLILDLALVSVGIFYVMIQQLRVDDLKRFALHEALDELVEEEMA
jgi:membrane associated rhomboid family serine protease